MLLLLLLLLLFQSRLIDYKKETMERERRESYRKCNLINCEHVNHDDIKIKVKHKKRVTRKG